MQIYDLYIVM